MDQSCPHVCMTETSLSLFLCPSLPLPHSSSTLLSRFRVCTCVLSLSLSLALSLSLSLSRSYARSFSRSLLPLHFLFLASVFHFVPALSLNHSQALSITRSLARSLHHSLSQSRALSLALSITRSFTLSLSQSRALSITRRLFYLVSPNITLSLSQMPHSLKYSRALFISLPNFLSTQTSKGNTQMNG